MIIPFILCIIDLIDNKGGNMPLKFGINKRGSDYIIADIHGCYGKLMNTLDSVEFNFETDRVFCVGDMVDRGPDSLKVLQLLDTEWFFSVVGNHEYMTIQYLDSVVSISNTYINNGGQWFIELPEHEQYRVINNYINRLPIAIEVETLIGQIGIIHADCPNDWLDIHEKIREEKLLEWIWNRNRYKYNDNTVIDNIRIVYHGHTVVPYNIVKGNRVYMDTGAVFNKDSNLINIIKLG